MIVNILGTEYAITLDVDPESNKYLNENFGYCDMHSKKIVCADLLKIEGWKDETEEVRNKQRKATLRHEIIHGFLCESGLWGSSVPICAWAINEEMIDWIALQFPKILEAFQQVNAI